MRTKYATWTCRCGISYSVSMTDPDLHLLPKRIKCWSPAATCRYYLTRDDKKPKRWETRAIEIFKIMNALGTEKERKCGPEDIKKLIVGKKITGVALEGIAGQDRSLVNSLTVEGGVTLYLSTSTKGATIYKVNHG